MARITNLTKNQLTLAIRLLRKSGDASRKALELLWALEDQKRNLYPPKKRESNATS